MPSSPDSKREYFEKRFGDTVWLAAEKAAGHILNPSHIHCRPAM